MPMLMEYMQKMLQHLPTAVQSMLHYMEFMPTTLQHLPTAVQSVMHNMEYMQKEVVLQLVHLLL